MRLFTDDAWAVATIWQEARGEPMTGKVAVARVIRNRMRFRYSSDGTVAGTVLRSYQFSGWNTQDPNRVPAGKLDDSDPVVQECAEAWGRSEMEDSGIGDAVLYYAPLVAKDRPAWAKPENRVAEVGGHVFFRA